LQDALGIAAGLHEYYRNSDIYFMANYAQTVNVIGCIKTSKTDAAFDTTGLVLKLYRREFGEIPVIVEGFEKPLDVSAALSSDRRKLTIGVVNPSNESKTLDLNVNGVELSGQGKCWRIGGPDRMEGNVPGQEPKVKIVEDPISVVKNQLQINPVSVALFSLELK
jgi:alpha-L-arabinofuranosidase